MSYLKKHGDVHIHVMHIHAGDDKPHTHTFFELVYVIDGTAEHLLESSTTTLRKGNYFIIDTGSTHCYRNTDHFEIVNCLFMPEYVDRALVNCPSLAALLSNQSLRFGVPVSIHAADRVYHDTDGTVARLIRQMEQEYSEKETGYKEQLRCLLTQILVLAVRAAAAAERPVHPAVVKALTYIQQHLDQPLSLNSLSRHCGYTPQYISSLFRQNTGMTLQHYLQQLRIERARHLLEQGITDPAALAQAVGYNDVKHFSQLFRRITGSSVKKHIRR